jgi:hypothetical protein
MRPRIVRVHRPRQRAELVRHRCEARAVGVVHPGEIGADVTSVRKHPGVLTGQLGKGGHDGESELIGKAEVRLVKRADHLAAELDDPAVGQRGLLHAATRPVACLEDDDVRAGIHQIASCAEAREASAHNHHVRFHGRILSCATAS